LPRGRWVCCLRACPGDAVEHRPGICEETLALRHQRRRATSDQTWKEGRFSLPGRRPTEGPRPEPRAATGGFEVPGLRPGPGLPALRICPNQSPRSRPV